MKQIKTLHAIMNPTPPINLLGFVITLGLLIQYAGGILASKAANPLVSLGVVMVSAIFALGYASHLSYRRGFASGQAVQKSEEKV